MKIYLVILLLFSPLFLQAQTGNAANWLNVTIHVGPYVGISHPMKNTMRDQGFMPRSGNSWLGNSGPVPMVSQNGVVQLGLEKNIKNRWYGKFLLSKLKGKISGYSGQEGDLKMSHRMVSSALLLAYDSRDKYSRLAFGPAVHFYSMEGDWFYSFTDPIKKNYTKIGLALEAGFRFPTQSRFFFDYNSQFFWVGRENLGFFNFEDSTGNGQPNIFEFDARKQCFNYFTFNFGLGVRFGKLKKPS